MKPFLKLTIILLLLTGVLVLENMSAKGEAAVLANLLLEDAIQVEENGRLYWTSGNTIYAAAPDGTGKQTLITGMPLRGAVFTTAGDTMYGIGNDGAIRRANADGSGLTTLFMAGQNPVALRLEENGGKLYWGESDRIRRMNTDGSQVETIVTGVTMPIGLILDAAGGKLYWIDRANERTIRRSNLDGSNVEDVFVNDPDNRSFGCFSLDPVSQKLFWHMWEVGFSGPVMRANLDGSGLEALPLPYDTCPFLDIVGRKLYWRTIEQFPTLIQRADLDGTNVETIVNNLSSANNLTFDPVAEIFYWTTGTADPKIQRAGLDGVVEDVVLLPVRRSGADQPTGLSLHPGGVWMYWPVNGQLQRAERSGANQEAVIVGAIAPRFVLVNPLDSRIYWGDLRDIRSMASDGSDVKAFFTDSSPLALTVDAANEMLYWVAQSPQTFLYSVQRAPLATLEIEDLGPLSGLTVPMALDPANLKLYAYHSGGQVQGGIVSADLNGANETLLIPETRPIDLALDVPGEKLYWSIIAEGEGKVQQANLDGSQASDLLTGLADPGTIALDTPNGRIFYTAETPEANAAIWRAGLAGGNSPELLREEIAISLYFDPDGVSQPVPGANTLYLPLVIR